jgi:3-methyl-2-oxobutanoate hydroxymethyltransferase
MAYSSTVHATVSMMATHIAAVRRGAPDKFIVGDMPFLAAPDASEAKCSIAVSELMQAGSNAIKLKVLRVSSTPSPTSWSPVCP